MKKVRTHTGLGKFALAIVFILASSGFTMVLHSCLMEGMACCAGMASASASTSASDSEMPSGSRAPTDGVSLVKFPSSCCENTVVGGLTTTPATLEGQKSTVQQKIVISTFSPEHLDGVRKDCPSLVSLQHFRSPDFPPTAIYLSNASLLI